jgi:hypothetical protein
VHPVEVGIEGPDGRARFSRARGYQQVADTEPLVRVSGTLDPSVMSVQVASVG